MSPRPPRAAYVCARAQVHVSLLGLTMSGEGSDGVSHIRNMYEDIMADIKEDYATNDEIKLIDATESTPVWECGPSAPASGTHITPPPSAARRRSRAF